LKGETVRHIDVNVDNGEEGAWGDWTELGVLDPGERLEISLKSEHVQIAHGWHGSETACEVPQNGLVGPFDTMTRMSARVKQTSFRIEGNLIES
jgi:hypothetical protein